MEPESDRAFIKVEGVSFKLEPHALVHETETQGEEVDDVVQTFERVPIFQKFEVLPHEFNQNPGNFQDVDDDYDVNIGIGIDVEVAEQNYQSPHVYHEQQYQEEEEEEQDHHQELEESEPLNPSDNNYYSTTPPYIIDTPSPSTSASSSSVNVQHTSSSKRAIISNHLYNSASTPSFRCNHCIKAFSSQWDLENHCSTAHNIPKNFKCPICLKQYSYARFFNAHMQQHHNSRHQKRKVSVQVTKPATNPRSRSSLPATTTTTIATPTTTNTTVTEKKVYKCGLCPGVFYNDCESLLEHTLREHVEDNGEYRNRSQSKSEAVSETVPTIPEPESDPQFLGEEPPKGFQCHLCPKSYDRYVSYKAHIAQAHTRKLNDQYRRSGNKNKGKARSSQNTNSKLERLPKLLPLTLPLPTTPSTSTSTQITLLGDNEYRCHLCSESFEKKTSLRAHVTQAHIKKLNQKLNKVQAFPCPHPSCTKSYASHAGLRHHELDHSGIKPFACGICGNRFKRNCDLTTHKYSHSQVKKYMCPERNCFQSFSGYIGLKFHKIRFHGGRKFGGPAAYSIATSAKEKMQVRRPGPKHRTTHSQGRVLSKSKPLPILTETSESDPVKQRQPPGKKLKFQCHICPHSFHRAGSLRAHRAHHVKKMNAKFNTVQQFKCPQCPKSYSAKQGLRHHMMSWHNGEDTDSPGLSPHPYPSPPSENPQESLNENFNENGTESILSSLLAPEPEDPLQPATTTPKNKFNTVRRFKCSKCPKHYAVKQGLTIHFAKTHMSSSILKKFACPELDCKNSFHSHLGLKIHLSRFHKINSGSSTSQGTGATGLITKLRQKLVGSENFNDGENIVDDDQDGDDDYAAELEYECDVCVRKFRRRCDLTVHRATHDTIKKYRCPEGGCEGSFSSTTGLKLHRANHHSLVSDYVLPEQSHYEDPEQNTGMDPNSFIKCEMGTEENEENAAAIDLNAFAHSDSEMASDPLSNFSAMPLSMSMPIQYQMVTADTKPGMVKGPFPTATATGRASKLQFKCHICTSHRVFFRAASLRAHISQAHVRKVNQKLKNLRSMSPPKSVPLALQLGKFTCNICYRVFDRAVSLRSHISQAHVRKLNQRLNRVQKYRCSKCPKSYSAKQGLTSHIAKTHENYTRKHFLCSEANCENSFETYLGLKVHLARFHHKVKNQEQEQNGTHMDMILDPAATHEEEIGPDRNRNQTESENVFTSLPLSMSMPIFGDPIPTADQGPGPGPEDVDPLQWETTTFSCHICPERFGKQSSLKAHIVQAHIRKRNQNSVKRFRCSLCSNSYATLSGLRHHEQIHSGVRAFGCELCGKTFLRNSDLKSHKLVHNAIKKYVCTEIGCNQSFSSHVGHKLHRANYHGGEKPFGCQVCGKSYVLQSQLERHSVVHTKRRPFPCDICSVGFRSSQALRKHRLGAHHGHGKGNTFNSLISSGPIVYCKVCHMFSTDDEKMLAIHYEQDHGLPVVDLQKLVV